jgi:hypothetical protein
MCHLACGMIPVEKMENVNVPVCRIAIPRTWRRWRPAWSGWPDPGRRAGTASGRRSWPGVDFTPVRFGRNLRIKVWGKLQLCKYWFCGFLMIVKPRNLAIVARWLFFYSSVIINYPLLYGKKMCSKTFRPKCVRNVFEMCSKTFRPKWNFIKSTPAGQGRRILPRLNGKAASREFL